MEDAFDGCAVLTLPTDDFGGAESPVVDLRGEVAEFARCEMVDRGDVKLGHVRAVFGGESHGLEIFGQRRVPADEGIGRSDTGDLRRRGIETEQMRRGLLKRLEIDAVGPPIEETRIFVELRG